MCICERHDLIYALNSKFKLIIVINVAPGELFYRLATRYGLALTSASVMRALFPRIQFGVGKRSGIERAFHLLRTLQQQHKQGVTIKLDVSNAFNTVSRTHVANVLYSNDKLGHLFRLFEFAYGSASPLIMFAGSSPFAQLKSVEGVKQRRTTTIYNLMH